MAKREKIIVFFAIVAVIYGAYELLFPSSPKKTTVKKDERVETSLPVNDKIKTELEKIALQNDIYIVRQAAVPWQKDPFSDVPMVSDVVIQKNKIILEKLRQLSYSGYIAIGEKRFAIINGMEYEAGDELAAYEDCFIHDISLFQVIIKMKGGEEISIPLIEELMGY